MSPKKSFLERMGLIEPAKPTIEVGKKNQNDGEKRVLGDVKLKRQPAEPMARSTEGQPVSQNVVELEQLRKEMEMAVSDYNQKSAEIHEGRDTSFENDISKMRKSVVDETYEDGVLDPTPQFNFDDTEGEESSVDQNAADDKEDNKPKFFFKEASLDEQIDKLLSSNDEPKKAVSSGATDLEVDKDLEIKPESVLEEIVQDTITSPFNEPAAKTQVLTQPQDTFTLLESKAEEQMEDVLEEKSHLTEGTVSDVASQNQPLLEEVESESVQEEIVQNSVASPFNEFAAKSQIPTQPHFEKQEEELVMEDEDNNLLLMNQGSLQSSKVDDRYKEEFQEQIQEKIHEQIEERFEQYKEDKRGLKEELKKELELEWKREIKEELRQELRKDIKEDVIQDVAQDVNQFKDEITNKVITKQEAKINTKAENMSNDEMKSEWDEELSSKAAKRDIHAQYLDDQFVEETVEEAVVEVVEPDHREDVYIEDLMKEYQPGYETEAEFHYANRVEDIQERGRSNETMDRNKMSEEATSARKVEETEAHANPIQVKQEFTSTTASAFKPDLHIGEKLDLIIGQYEKNKLQSIEEIYKNSRMETDTKKTIFMADVFLKAIPANLPQDVKRETVLNILKISGIELDSLLGDAYQRIDSLNKVLEDTISTSNEIFKRNEDTIHELERRIQDLNEINVNRAKFQEDQNTMVEYEIQKIINLVEFVKPKSR